MTESSTLPACGFLYVAFGSRHLEEALRSVASLRRFNPGACVALVTDGTLESSPFDHVVTRPPPAMQEAGNYHVKIEGLCLSPFQRTIYLDTDTLVCSGLTNLFPLFDRFDLLVTLNAWRVDRAFEDFEEPYSSVPHPFMACNTGFVGFAARPVVEDLLANWARQMETQIGRFGETNDQPAFRWALYHSSARYCVLSNAHNYHAHNPFMLPGYQELAVLHDRRPLMEWYAKVHNGTSRMLRPRNAGRISLPLTAAFCAYATAGLLRRVWRRISRVFRKSPPQV